MISYKPHPSESSRNSIRHLLLTSKTPSVGLQMIEEYISSKLNYYYKCILCGVHGDLDSIYRHVTGPEHTDNYIRTSYVLETSILTPYEREVIKKELVLLGDSDVSDIKTIEGDDYYPFKWEAEVNESRTHNEMRKHEQRSLSDSPEPGPSGIENKKRKTRLPSPSRHIADRHRRHTCSSSSGDSSGIRSRSHSPRIQSLHPEFADTHHTPSAENQQYVCQSRSPPSPIRIKTKPSSPPLDCSSPIFSVKVKTEDNFTQTDCDSDLEELMMQLNFIVKAFERNPQDVEIKTLEDMNVVIYMMSIFSEALRILPIMLLSENESSLSPAEKERLHYQKEKREKIISYVTKWYQPTYRKLLEKAKDSQRDHSN